MRLRLVGCVAVCYDREVIVGVGKEGRYCGVVLIASLCHISSTSFARAAKLSEDHISWLSARWNCPCDVSIIHTGDDIDNLNIYFP